MKQRIIVAVIGIPLLLAILCVAPDWATAALLAALSVVGTHELLAAVCGPEKTRRWTALPAVMGILVVLHFTVRAMDGSCRWASWTGCCWWA